jgi:hypothetical protein
MPMDYFGNLGSKATGEALANECGVGKGDTQHSCYDTSDFKD